MVDRIKMSHGSGGRLMHRLITDLFRKHFAGEATGGMDDAAELPAGPEALAFTVDSFVVKPLFFPGGDLGKLAICGTVNDLVAKGAKPEYLSAAFILEEGLEMAILEKVVLSMAAAATEAGVKIVTGDTKVVEKGSGDGIFISTSGIGRIFPGVDISGGNAAVGDQVIVTGTVADHGAAIMMARAGLDQGKKLLSDCASLAGMLVPVFKGGIPVHVLRDPTRGGLATTLVEIADHAGHRIVLKEENIPVAPPVRQACDLLGLDPIYVANEGKMIAIVPQASAPSFLEMVRSHPLGKAAAVIGEVEAGDPGLTLETTIGGRRPLIMLEGDPLPRIC